MNAKKTLFKNLSVKTIAILGVVFTLASLLLKNAQVSIRVAIFFVFVGLLSFWESRASRKADAMPNSSFNSRAHRLYLFALLAAFAVVIGFGVYMYFMFR